MNRLSVGFAGLLSVSALVVACSGGSSEATTPQTSAEPSASAAPAPATASAAAPPTTTATATASAVAPQPSASASAGKGGCDDAKRPAACPGGGGPKCEAGKWSCAPLPHQ